MRNRKRSGNVICLFFLPVKCIIFKYLDLFIPANEELVLSSKKSRTGTAVCILHSLINITVLYSASAVSITNAPPPSAPTTTKNWPCVKLAYLRNLECFSVPFVKKLQCLNMTEIQNMRLFY